MEYVQAHKCVCACVCMHMYLCACICVYVCVHAYIVCVYVCVSEVSFQCLYLIFLRQDLSLNLKLTHLSRLAGE